MRSFLQGANYFAQGLQGLSIPKVKRFIIIPLLINLIFIGGASSWVIGEMGIWKQSLEDWLWESLQFLMVLFWPIIIGFIFIIVFYTFTILSNWIAAPFNGLLAEIVEKHESPPGPPSFSVLKDLPRIFGREFKKLMYYVPRVLGLVVLSILVFIIPFLAFLSPFIGLIWFLFSAWMMAIQYIDYSYDNHQGRFIHTLSDCKKNRAMALGFGCMVMFFTMIPFVNILVMPIAVIGSTKMFVEHFKPNMRIS
jgi:CysZ protein